MIRHTSSRLSWLAAGLCALLMTTAPRAGAQASAEPEEFSAFAINMGRLGTGGTAQIIINISRWTSEGERDGLFGALREKGQRALIDAFRDTTRVGSIRTPHTVGYDLHFAYQEPAPEGRRRILIATDRPISFGEATSRPPTMDYPFTVIEMMLSPDSKGKGTMHIASRLVPAGKTILVENYDIQPVQLTNIESRTLTR